MPWNEPGGSGGGDRDPWGKKQNGNSPDLDEMVKKLKSGFGGIFGSGGSSSGEGGGKAGLGILAVVLLGIWLASGVYIVNQGEASVVLRFGKFTEVTSAGLHWRFPTPIESNYIINVEKVNTVTIGYRDNPLAANKTNVEREALMLTADENIVDVKFAVQYKISDPKEYLFNVSDTAEEVVRQTTESAVREVVGRSSMDFVLTSGRSDVVQQTRSLVQVILDRYKTGIQVVTVEMQNAQPPAQVKPAFDDAVKAREDEERLKNEASAYSAQVLKTAQGEVDQKLAEAGAYGKSVVERAYGETIRFSEILSEYKNAPAVTRDRLYLDSMESVLSNSSKMLVDQKSGNNVLYLPLDRMMQDASKKSLSTDDSPSPTSGTVQSSDGSRNSSTSRSRTDLRKRVQ